MMYGTPVPAGKHLLQTDIAIMGVHTWKDSSEIRASPWNSVSMWVLIISS